MGFGMASVRFICGTQDIHKELEAALTKFLGQKKRSFIPPASTPTADYSQTLLTRNTDAVISDQKLNPRQHHRRHPPLPKVHNRRFRDKHKHMADLESATPRGARCALHRFNCHRRCFLDGPHNREPIGHLRLAEKVRTRLTMMDRRTRHRFSRQN